jgi:hypothetical protein
MQAGAAVDVRSRFACGVAELLAPSAHHLVSRGTHSDTSRMKLAALALALSGCVTASGIAQHQSVSLPWLVGAGAADLVVTSLATSQIRDYSYAGSIATGLALTAVDVAVGCLTGACSSLKL